MTDQTKLKLRLVMASVIGLALVHLLAGRYEFYPLIRWTMFATKHHHEIKSVITETVVIAIDGNGQEHIVHLKSLFGAIPGSSGAAKSVSKRYINRLHKSDPGMANRLAAVIESRLSIQNIVALRVEEWRWDVDVQAFRAGTILNLSASKRPDHKVIISEITLKTEAD